MQDNEYEFTILLTQKDISFLIIQSQLARGHLNSIAESILNQIKDELRDDPDMYHTVFGEPLVLPEVNLSGSTQETTQERGE